MSVLTNALREALNTTTLTDPDDLAHEVIDILGPERLDDAAEEALIYWVRSHTSRSRQGVPDELLVDTGTPASFRPAPNRSAKVAGIRDWWSSFITERVNVDGEWKLMGDCTVPDVEALAAARREIASKNLAHADRYAALADRMRAEGVATVQDLAQEKVADLAA